MNIQFGYNLFNMNIKRQTFSPTDTQLGQTIRQYRLLADLTQRACVARMSEIDGSIGINQSRLSKIERGQLEAKWRELRAIAIATETDINVFIEAS